MADQTNGKKTLTAWEVAKPLLLKWYQDGIITDAMKPRMVWEMKNEFKAVKYNNFRDNFATMKRSIKINRYRAATDLARYIHDVSHYPLARDSPGYWHSSDAQRLLKEDILRRRHEGMKSKALWLSRQEYQAFGLEKFRGHLHQQLRSDREFVKRGLIVSLEMEQERLVVSLEMERVHHWEQSRK